MDICILKWIYEEENSIFFILFYYEYSCIEEELHVEFLFIVVYNSALSKFFSIIFSLLSWNKSDIY